MRLVQVAGLALLVAIGVAGLLDVLESDAEPRARPHDGVVRVPTAPSADSTATAARLESTEKPSLQRSVPAGEAADVAAWFEEGSKALDAGEHAAAVASFERCVAARPAERAYSQSLAEALARLALDEYEGGARDAALARMERAHALAPERDDVSKILARWREILSEEKELWQYESDHFVLAFDAQKSDLLYGAQDVLDVLEAAYHEFGLLFDFDLVKRRRERVRVILSDRDAFQRMTGLGEWAGGAFDGAIRLPLSDLTKERATWEPVLRHELVHVFVHESGKKHVPGWLNEGLAQWLESDREKLLVEARGLVRGVEPFSLQELKGSLLGWEDPDEIRRAYAQALIFVDSLASNYGVEMLVHMVAGCIRGGNPGDVFETRTGIPLATAFADVQF